MLDTLRADARLYHALRYPGRKATWWTSLRVLLGSRGLLLLAEHRVVSRWRARAPGFVSRVATLLLDYFVHVLTKSEIRGDTVLEGGVHLSDGGHIILGARAIGSGTIIHERVTIGWGRLAGGTPEIGRDVWIGPRTVIAGNIKVGDGATILPESVLTRSVPPGFVVQGNPARIVPCRFDSAALRRTLSTDVSQLVTAERCPG